MICDDITGMKNERMNKQCEMKIVNNKNNKNDNKNNCDGLNVMKENEVNVYENDKLELVEVYHVETSDKSDQVRIVFDTGASSNMSGLPERLHEIFPQTDYNIMISGYDGSKCIVDLVGLNEDSKRELYCKKMPPGLVLLSGQQYAAEGAAILYKDEGVVIQLEDEELKSLKRFVEQFTVLKKLKVKNGIYEVVRNSPLKGDITDEGFMVIEESFTGRANRFFNTKVHVSNGTDRVLSMLMMGLSLEDLKLLVKHKSLSGMPADLTERVISTFEHRHGRTPDIITLAIPVNRMNRSGLMDKPEELTKVGQRIEVDCAESDYNEERNEKEKKSKKLVANGGAIAFAVCVDCYSGYMISVLLTSTGEAIKFVKRFVEEYRNMGHEIKTFAADSGVVSQSKYQVFEPEVETYLREEGIQIHRAEPYNHQMGTSTVENAIGKIKKLVNIAVTYILLNPAFQQTGFTERQIKQLWGVLVFWATTVQNLKPCPRQPDKTRYEVMHGVKPNMQNIRMLPIFSIILIPRDGKELQNGINKTTHRIGMYVGPTLSTTGAIRVAYLSRKKKVQLTITSKFTPASDGWGLNIHQNVSRGLNTLLQIEKEEEDKVGDVEEIERGNDNVTTTDVDKTYMDTTNVEQEQVIQVSEEKEEDKGNMVNEKDMFEEDDSSDHDSIDKQDELEPVIEEERKEEVSDHPKKNKKKPRRRSKKDKKSNKEISEETKPKKVKKKGKVAFVDSYDKTYKTTSAQSTERYQNRTKLVEESLLADWITHEEVCYYLSFADLKIYKIVEWIEKQDSEISEDKERNMKVEVLEVDGFKAVTENVPKSFTLALHDPRWGEPARKEFRTLIDSKAIVKISKELAEQILKKQGADLVILFPVYETKEKNGVWVDKVRLVGDGRTHYSAEFTYAATPSREEFLLLTHLIAAMDWSYFHVDEIRAFLNAPYKGGSKKVITKFRGDNENYFEVLGALYGLKSSPRDYQQVVIERLVSIGFKKLALCSCIFVYKENENIVFIYDFVDDFIVTGNNHECVVRKINELREKATTTDPIENASKVLGMNLSRNRQTKIIEITMTDKIVEICNKWEIENEKKRTVPMPARGYVVSEEDLEELPQEDRLELNKDEVQKYLAIVGCLVWLSGVRLDIVFSTMYLTWHTKKPRKHHLKMAIYVLSYLYHTRDIPLILGGEMSINKKVEITSYSDASLGTGPKGRSIKANMLKLGNNSGSIVAKSGTSTSVYTSSFEAELDGVTTAYKTSLKILNIFKELGIEVEGGIVNLHNDNMAMVKFVQGEGVAKGIRHVELRMYYLREKYLEGNVVLHYMEGKNLPVDQMTKIGSHNQFYKFREDVLGLRLSENWKDLDDIKEEVEEE